MPLPKYRKLLHSTLHAVFSDNQDYSDPRELMNLVVDKRTSRFRQGRVSAPTTGVTLTNTLFVQGASRPIWWAFKNLDATNYVTLTYRTSGGAGTTQTTRLYPGALAIIPNVDISTLSPALTANTAACSVDFVAGQVGLTVDP